MSTIPFERSFASHPKAQYWSEKNELSPEYYTISSGKKCWFKCECGHEFYCILANIVNGRWCPYCSKPPKKLCNDENCKSCFEKSFASYEDKDKLMCWSIDNKDKDGKHVIPRDIFKSSNKKYIFNCQCGHEFESELYLILKNGWCPYCANPPKQLCNNDNCQSCFEKSFASHPKSQYWCNKNKLNPRNIFKGTHDKYLFNCDCGHEFESMISNISKENDGRWCSYCSDPPKQLCNNNNCQSCFQKSFASHPKSQCWSDKNKLKPRDVFKSSGKIYIFNCICGHEFEKKISEINKEGWCPYCCNPPKQLCDKDNCQSCFEKSFASHPKSQYWSDKNKLKPRDVFKRSSTNKYIFNCEKGHEFENTTSNISINVWCPKCKNKTEQKLFEALKVDYPDLKHQFKEEWCKNPITNKHLPFDFVLEKEKIIIELDGRQHFEQVSNWSTPEEQYERDTYKMECANQNGYSVIRITQEDVYDDTFDWYKMLKESIETIIQKESVENHYISYEDDYIHFN